ncbi:23S rRNA-specific endonuclease VapC20 [subsurface metagenome]
MRFFIDTSAFYALIDADDRYHEEAKKEWIKMLNKLYELVCSNYVVLETFALIQSRIGINAVRSFEEDILPVVKIEWVDADVHHAGVSALLTASRRDLSLVDCVSFDLMRRHGLQHVFAFDEHFTEQGFQVSPK